jgi:hypothetical protein
MMRSLREIIESIMLPIIRQHETQECDMVWPDAATRAAMREARERELEAAE